MTLPDLKSLSPAQRTDLIYRAARDGLDAQLWQAALGRAPLADPLGSPQPAPGSRLSLDALVQAFSIEERHQPRLTDALQPAGPPATIAGDMPALRLGSNREFTPLLEGAAARNGLDPAMLASIVDAEAARRPDGSWDPASRNPRSSASGLGQFIDSTWLGEARRPGSWLAREAAARGWTTPGGDIRPENRQALLALRFDARASIEVTADHAAANLRRLRAAGIAPGSPAEQARAAYLAHHLGLGDALRFLGQGLSDERAGRLLAAQVGGADASRRIAEAGSAAEAHRAWLLAYVDRRIRPERFAQA